MDGGDPLRYVCLVDAGSRRTITPSARHCYQLSGVTDGGMQVQNLNNTASDNSEQVIKQVNSMGLFTLIWAQWTYGAGPNIDIHQRVSTLAELTPLLKAK